MIEQRVVYGSPPKSSASKAGSSHHGDNIMRYALPQAQRYDLAAKIGFFLVKKGLKSWGVWFGKLTKSEQINSFGFYIGKGQIEVNGEKDYIAMTIRVCFGSDHADVFFASAQTGWLSIEGNRKAPIEELNLYSSLNIWNEVAA